MHFTYNHRSRKLGLYSVISVTDSNVLYYVPGMEYIKPISRYLYLYPLFLHPGHYFCAKPHSLTTYLAFRRIQVNTYERFDFRNRYLHRLRLKTRRFCITVWRTKQHRLNLSTSLCKRTGYNIKSKRNIIIQACNFYKDVFCVFCHPRPFCIDNRRKRKRFSFGIQNQWIFFFAFEYVAEPNTFWMPL